MADKTKELEEIKGSNALIPWEQEMERDAQKAAEMEKNTGGGNFFSLKAGVLAFNGAAMPGNQIGAIILDTVMENVFYEGAYDPDQTSPPTCFAFGRSDETIAPHETVVARDQAQHETCAGCPMNAWGSADKGKGKACSNRRRLALIAAGEWAKDGTFTAYDDPKHFSKTDIGMMKLPTMSLAGYATFVKQVAGALKRPPYGIFTRISVAPDPKSQFRVHFEAIANVPNDIMPIIMQRRQEAMLSIEQPYNLDGAEAPEAKKAEPAKKRPEVKKPKKY